MAAEVMTKFVVNFLASANMMVQLGITCSFVI